MRGRETSAQPLLASSDVANGAMTNEHAGPTSFRSKPPQRSTGRDLPRYLAKDAPAVALAWRWNAVHQARRENDPIPQKRSRSIHRKWLQAINLGSRLAR